MEDTHQTLNTHNRMAASDPRDWGKREAPTGLMTLDELLDCIPVGRSVAYDLARQDKLPIPVIRIGKRIYFSRQALADLLARQHQSPRAGCTRVCNADHVADPK